MRIINLPVDWESKSAGFRPAKTIRTKEDLIPRVQLIFKTIGDHRGAFYLNSKRIGEKLPEDKREEILNKSFQAMEGFPIATKVFDRRHCQYLNSGESHERQYQRHFTSYPGQPLQINFTQAQRGCAGFAAE